MGPQKNKQSSFTWEYGDTLWPAAGEPLPAPPQRSAHRLPPTSTSPPPLQCDFQLSSTARSETTHLRRIRTQAKWSPVSEFTITGRLSSIVRSVNWSEVVPPYSAKVTTKCDLQRKVGCVYTRAVYHPGSNLCLKHKRLPFMCSFFNSHHVQTVCAFARGWRWFSIQFDIDVSRFLMINS